MHPNKVNYIVTRNVNDIAFANALLQKNGIDTPLGEHVIIAKQGKKIRGAISLSPEWRKIDTVAVGPIYADSRIVYMRLGEAMEIELTRMGISHYYMCVDKEDLKLQKWLTSLGLVFIGKDKNDDLWYRRDL